MTSEGDLWSQIALFWCNNFALLPVVIPGCTFAGWCHCHRWAPGSACCVDLTALLSSPSLSALPGSCLIHLPLHVCLPQTSLFLFSSLWSKQWTKIDGRITALLALWANVSVERQRTLPDITVFARSPLAFLLPLLFFHLLLLLLLLLLLPPDSLDSFLSDGSIWTWWGMGGQQQKQ